MQMLVSRGEKGMIRGIIAGVSGPEWPHMTNDPMETRSARYFPKNFPIARYSVSVYVWEQKATVKQFPSIDWSQPDSHLELRFLHWHACSLWLATNPTWLNPLKLGCKLEDTQIISDWPTEPPHKYFCSILLIFVALSSGVGKVEKQEIRPRNL